MNIEIPQRNDLLLRVRLLDPEGSPVDPTGSDFRFVATYVGKTVFTKRLRDGIEIEDDGERVSVGITNEDTDVRPGIYDVELLMIDVEGARYSILRGRMHVTPSIIGRDEE